MNDWRIIDKSGSALTEHGHVIFDEECDFVIWNVMQEIQSLTESPLHQADSVSCQHSVADL